MSSSNSTLKSTPTFQVNDRVEAFWRDDGEWHPAEVLKVVRNNRFRIRFDGYLEKYDFKMKDLRMPEQGSARAGGGAAAPPAASENEGGSKCTVDSTLKSTPTFQVNDRVEAFWRDDGEWYPAEVLKVVRNNRFRIRFDGYAGKYVFKMQRLRVPEQGSARAGGGAAVSGLQAFKDSLNAIAESFKQRLKTAAPADLCHRHQRLRVFVQGSEQDSQTLAAQHCGS
jgi:hypothetical protein